MIFPFPEQQILTLFQELESCCTLEACGGDVAKPANRTKVLRALHQHQRTMWTALVERKLTGKGGIHSIPLSRPKIDHPLFVRPVTDPTNPLAWLLPTEQDDLAYDFKLMLQELFFSLCGLLEAPLATPAPYPQGCSVLNSISASRG